MTYYNLAKKIFLFLITVSLLVLMQLNYDSRRKIKNMINFNYGKMEILVAQQNLTNIARTSNEMGVRANSEAKDKLVVSLTSYGHRVRDVYLVIESIFQQTYKPDKIVLWLSKDEYNQDNIPIMLQKAQKRGLEVRFCKDLKSYKKLIPTLKLYPDYLIVTIDDDVMFPNHMLEELYNAYKKNPRCIHAHHMARITFKNKDGKQLKSYNQWETVRLPSSSLLNLPIGVGGVLYFPGCFHKDITNEDLFMELAPNADDIWFKAMSLLNDVKCNFIRKSASEVGQFLYIMHSQDQSLWHKNIDEDTGNNPKIKRVFEHYKLYDKLKSASLKED